MLQGFYYIQTVVGNGISEASTVGVVFTSAFQPLVMILDHPRVPMLWYQRQLTIHNINFGRELLKCESGPLALSYVVSKHVLFSTCLSQKKCKSKPISSQKKSPPQVQPWKKQAAKNTTHPTPNKDRKIQIYVHVYKISDMYALYTKSMHRYTLGVAPSQ